MRHVDFQVCWFSILISWFWEGRWVIGIANSGFKMVSTSSLKGPSNVAFFPHRWWYKMLLQMGLLKFKCRTFQTNRSGRKKRGGWIATPKCMRGSLSMSLFWICSALSFQFLHPQNARRETFIHSVFWRPYFPENQCGISSNLKNTKLNPIWRVASSSKAPFWGSSC